MTVDASWASSRCVESAPRSSRTVSRSAFRPNGSRRPAGRRRRGPGGPGVTREAGRAHGRVELAGHGHRARCRRRRRRVRCHPMGRGPHGGRPVPGLGAADRRPDPPAGRRPTWRPPTVPGGSSRGTRVRRAGSRPAGRPRPLRRSAPSRTRRRASASDSHGSCSTTEAGSSRSVPAAASSGPDPRVWINRATAPQSSARA